MRKVVFALLVAMAATSVVPVFAGNLSETEVVAIAKDAVTGKGIAAEDAIVIYDKDNQKWIGWGEIVLNNPQDPNHGNLPKGILNEKTYHTIYFDFEETMRNDVWVFVDDDTGDVLAIYEVK